MLPPPSCVRSSNAVSSKENTTLANMFLGPKNAAKFGRKNKTALFAEDTVKPASWQPSAKYH